MTDSTDEHGSGNESDPVELLATACGSLLDAVGMEDDELSELLFELAESELLSSVHQSVCLVAAIRLGEQDTV